MQPATLVEPALLAQRLEDPSWAVIDCRFELAKPEWGREAYASAHIPGALYAHLDQDLSGPVTHSSGRHPLPDAAVLGATFGRLGIDESVQVIAYDQGAGAYAARLWWLLRWLGHPHVAVLDGGWSAWQQAGLPLDARPGARAARTFVACPGGVRTLSAGDVLQGLPQFAAGEALLVDARSAERFRGENETVDSVAGHVPGARNYPYTSNLGADGRFLPQEKLRKMWQERLAGAPAAELVSMCGSGVTACHNLLALEHAGLPGAALYAGSWSEWIRDPTRPVAR